MDKQRRSGRGQESDDEITISDFPWFTEINRIMGDRAVANPPNILDSADHEDWTKGEEEDDLFSQSGLLTPSSIGNCRPVTPSEWPVTPSDTAGPSVKDTSLKHTVDTSLVQTADVIDCDAEGTSGDRQDEVEQKNQPALKHHLAVVVRLHPPARLLYHGREAPLEISH